MTQERKLEILKHVDHTFLKQDAAWDQIERLCKEAIKYNTASVCIPASYVKDVKEKYGDKIKVCTVIGFPNGYSTTEVKVFEAKDAILNGADEIDMVINIGWVKDEKYTEILKEINKIKEACGEKILKVIIETCLLTNKEKEHMTYIVSVSKADYIKTSTGFSTNGATREDINLFAKEKNASTKIKAAGGISSFEDADVFLKLGADRLGTSKLINLF